MAVRTRPLKICGKGGVARVTWPKIFGRRMLIDPKRLQLQTSNLTNMLLGKFRTLSFKYFFRNGAWPGSRDPRNVLVLNAYSSKMVKAMDFKFDRHVPNYTLNFFGIGGVTMVT